MSRIKSVIWSACLLVLVFSAPAQSAYYLHDADIEGAISAHVKNKYPYSSIGSSIKFRSANGIVVLAGFMKNASDAKKLEGFVKSIPHVKKLEASLSVSNPAVGRDVRSDVAIEKILDNLEEKNNRLRTVVMDGSVYLLGLVSYAERDFDVAALSDAPGVKKITLLYEYVDTRENPVSAVSLQRSEEEGYSEPDRNDSDASESSGLGIALKSVGQALMASGNSGQAGAGYLAAGVGSIISGETNSLEEIQQPPNMQTQTKARPSASQMHSNGTQAYANAAPSGSYQDPSGSTNSSPYEYDTAYSECVKYSAHPSLKGYSQYLNTCGFSVSVLYCVTDKNGQDGCARRSFGSFELSPGASNLGGAGDKVSRYVACKLPFRAIGANTKFNGANMSVPCQKNR
ncbi:BON domain-containing protein [Pseudomonas huaxiensis]|uniref:BON domain-containing protein n=1 Tax=Pseudomonas huaxiensis TaxID=2213017 RepID=UPI000DA66D38|nr:BON domain-containing protein [Pseudomonas huaxiensis]